MGTRVSLHPQLRASRRPPVRRRGRRLQPGLDGRHRARPSATSGTPTPSSGATNLLDYGDVRGHRQHGLAAALVIEPQRRHLPRPRHRCAGPQRRHRRHPRARSGGLPRDGARLPGRPEPADQGGPQVPDKDVPDVGAGRSSPSSSRSPTAATCTPAGTEDAGEKGVNYTNAPLHRRLGAAPGALKVGATSAGVGQRSCPRRSTVTRATPIARAYAGDQLRMRVLGGNRPRQIGLPARRRLLAGRSRTTRESPLVGVQGGIGTGKAVNAHVRLPAAGDHLWSSPTTGGLPDGVWGLARVYPTPAAAPASRPTARPTPDNPFTTGAAPLQPLERTSVTVQVFTDTDGDGTRDAGEGRRRGRGGAAARAPPATRLATADDRRRRRGRSFSPLRGQLRRRGRGARRARGRRRRPSAGRPDRRTAPASRRHRRPGAASAVLRASVFEDLDADGVRDAGEPGPRAGASRSTGATAVDPLVDRRGRHGRPSPA